MPTPKILLKPSLPFNLNLWFCFVCNVLTQARVNFSKSETSSLLPGGWGGELNFELLLLGGVNRKDPKMSPEKTKTPLPKNSEKVFSDIFGSCN